jgi:hypothetical protein
LTRAAWYPQGEAEVAAAPATPAVCGGRSSPTAWRRPTTSPMAR